MENASQKLAVTEYDSDIRAIEEEISGLFEPMEEGNPTGSADAISVFEWQRCQTPGNQSWIRACG